jgi:predicted nucleic acid-binding protein
MNGIRIVCDTNPLIYLLDGDKDVAAFLNGKQISISVISELELFGKQHLSQADAMLIDALVDNCFVVDINREIIQIYKGLKQVYPIKLPDALIAATAIYLDIPLLTFDKGFKNIPELQLILWE